MSKLWRSLTDEQQAEMDAYQPEPAYDAEQAEMDAYQPEHCGLWVYTDAEDLVIKALFYNDFDALQKTNKPEYKDTIYSALWKIVRENEMRENAIKAEIGRLQQMRDASKNRIDKAKDLLKSQFEKDGKRKHDTALYSISLRNKPASIGTIDMSKLDERFIRTKQEPDRVSILNHFKETGEMLAGVEININQQSVVIK